MPAPRLHLPRGLPASGKSTLARQLAADGAVHVELDVFKRRLWPNVPTLYDPYTGRGLTVHLAWEAEVLKHLQAGRDVVADRTHLDPRAAARLRQLAPDARVVVHDLRHVDVETCIARDAARPDPLTRFGEAGIRAMWRQWIAPPVDDRPGFGPLVRPALAPSGSPCSPQAAPGAFEAARDRRTVPRASEARTERPASTGI